MPSHGIRKRRRQSQEYRVFIKPRRLDANESDIRVRKAFDIVFEEIAKSRRGKMGKPRQPKPG